MGPIKPVCEEPVCPQSCKTKGIVTPSGCCKCVCKSKPISCPTNCKLGTKLVTEGGRKKCVCVKPFPCPPFMCSRNCPPGSRRTKSDGVCKACSCAVKTCDDDTKCDNCPNGKRYENVDGCVQCKCCPRIQCPKNCDHGTEMRQEDGCTSCVCKCGPPICPICPATPVCRRPCELVPEGKNGCDICKCPSCQKNCKKFKHVNGKKICECCPSPF